MLIKFVLFSALCVSLIFHHFATLSNPRLELLGDGDFSIYSREVITSPLVHSVTNIGIGFVYTTTSSNAAALRAKFNQIDGESIVLSTFKEPSRILALLGYTKVSTQTLSDLHTIYAYSGRGRDFITSEGTRINLQIAVRGDRVTVGWPVILGSF